MYIDSDERVDHDVCQLRRQPRDLEDTDLSRSASSDPAGPPQPRPLRMVGDTPLSLRQIVQPQPWPRGFHRRGSTRRRAVPQPTMCDLTCACDDGRRGAVRQFLPKEFADRPVPDRKGPHDATDMMDDSFVVTQPEIPIVPSANSQKVGFAVAATNAAVATPMTGDVPAAADGASALTARFCERPAICRAICTQAPAIHQLLAATRGSGAVWYAAIEGAAVVTVTYRT